jgi:beta-lactamase regulating signal transducer with metallopeptidase domain
VSPARQVSSIRGDFEVLRDVTSAASKAVESDATYLARVTAALSAELAFAALEQLRLCLWLLAGLVVVLLILVTVLALGVS